MGGRVQSSRGGLELGVEQVDVLIEESWDGLVEMRVQGHQIRRQGDRTGRPNGDWVAADRGP